MTSQHKQPPAAVGLYDPRFEHDACGVGMVARLDNVATHEVVAHDGIESAEGLVENDQTRSIGERRDERRFHAHAAR